MNRDGMHHFRVIRRRQFMQLCAGSLALAAGCGRGGRRAGSHRDVLTVAYNDYNDLLYDEAAKYLVFLPLMTYSQDGELEGRLAERWEHSPDYREWTYRLRKDIRWHDGAPVTAHDIKFTMDLLIRPDVWDESACMFQSVTVLDDWTLKLRSAYTVGYQIGNVYYPQHLLGRLDPKKFYDWDFWRHPVGNGPYRFVSYLPKTMMEFEANPDYYKGKPRIEHLRLAFVGSYGIRTLAELLAGNVDVIAEADPAQIPKLKSDPQFRVYYQYSDGTAKAIYWQNRSPFFRDSRVRQALTLAINRRELALGLNLPHDIPILDGPRLGRHLRRGQLPEPLPYDPARARTLLEAAGWQDIDGDGIREKGGQKFHFAANIDGSEPSDGTAALYVQDALRRVGVRMDIQTLESGLSGARWNAGQFEAAFAPIGFNALGLNRWFGRGWLQRGSPIGYQNSTVVKLIDQALSTEEPTTQDQVYGELDRIFRAEVPITFLFLRVGTTFAHQRIQGLSTPWRADPLQFMEDLWLDDRSD